jgi:hypothetical protein
MPIPLLAPSLHTAIFYFFNKKLEWVCLLLFSELFRVKIRIEKWKNSFLNYSCRCVKTNWRWNRVDKFVDRCLSCFSSFASSSAFLSFHFIYLYRNFTPQTWEPLYPSPSSYSLFLTSFSSKTLKLKHTFSLSKCFFRERN